MDLGLPAKIDKENIAFTFEPLRNWNYKKNSVKPGIVKQNSSIYISEMQKKCKKTRKILEYSRFF